MTPANRAWLETIATVLDDGHEHTTTRELICHTVCVPMDAPVITLASRKLDYRAMCAETVDLLEDFKQVNQVAATLIRNNITPIINWSRASLQWLIRDEMLHCISAIGSSDVWLVLPHEVHAVSAISAYLALALRNHGIKIELGWLYDTAGSRHLHQRDIEAAMRCLNPESYVQFDYVPLNLRHFSCPDDLILHYHLLAKKEWPKDVKGWLMEAFA